MRMKTNRGFITTIIVILVAVLALSFFGLNPKVIWTDYALPILQFIWDALLTILGFVVDLGIELADRLGL